MKINVTGAILLCAWASAAAAAAAQDVTTPHDPMDAPEQAPMVLDVGEQRIPQQLREVLRQFMDRTNEALTPHRLSPEERHRMREQLRNPVTVTPSTPNKP